MTDVKEALHDIINLMGPYPYLPCSTHTGGATCEGCDYELNEVLLTAINAYTELPWNESDEHNWYRGRANKEEGKSAELVLAATHTKEERYAWWATHGMTEIDHPDSKYGKRWILTDHVGHWTRETPPT